MAYADDLTLLAPSAHAMRIMLQICSDYAKEYSVSFNAKKSKCMLFTPGRASSYPLRPSFYINDNVIEYVDSWPHLGNILNVNQSDAACILNRRNIMVGQINDVICYFGKLDPIVKTELLYTYCSSLYGSVLWDLQQPELDRICTAWRMALKRLWRLPFNTHRDIVSALSGRQPMFDELCVRIVNFHFTCLSSRNRTVSELTRLTMADEGAQSHHGRNLRFISSIYNLKYNWLCQTDGRNETLAQIRRHGLDRHSNFDVTSFSVLLELIMVRDGILDLAGQFSKSEIELMIWNLCTN